MRVDPRFQRISERLTAADLRVDDGDDDDDDFVVSRSARRFVDTYSEAGLRRVMSTASQRPLICLVWVITTS